LTTRPSFNRDYIFSELDKLSQRTADGTVVFVIGGLALINYGLKNATKDIDVVVMSSKDLNNLVESLVSENYHSPENYVLTRPYEEMEISRIMENSAGFRWDIFVRTICGRLVFSENMASRATTFYSKNKLELKMASREDIFLFKGITEREADLDDMRLIAESSLNWQVVRDECIYQSDHSGRLWEDALVQRLIDLRAKYGIRSPIEKELKGVCVEKMSQETVLLSLSKGNRTVKGISRDSKLPISFVRKITESMQEKGLVIVDKTRRPYIYSPVVHND
jgi:hypothetical protein